MIALYFDLTIFDRSTRAKSGLQLGGEFRQIAFIQRKVRDGRHALASPPFRFSTYTNHAGLAWGRWLVLACASLFELVALGAEQFPPAVFSHR